MGLIWAPNREVVGIRTQDNGVVSELRLFQIEREVSLEDARVFDDPLLGPTPDPL